MLTTERRPSPSTWTLIEKTADHIWDSGIAKEMRFHHRSAVVLVLLKGWELGLPLMSSLEHVRVIHGRFSLSAECQQAIALARVPGARFTWLQDGKTGVAEVLAERPGHDAVTVKFTHEDAQKTGLAQKNPIYAAFPGNLLRAAAIRGAIKRLFPDVILGMMGATAEDGSEEEEREYDREDEQSSAILEHVEALRASQPSLDEEPKARHELPQREAPAPRTEAPAKAPQPKSEKAPIATKAHELIPEDMRLPFTEGQWANICLSDLKAEDFPKMFRGFSARMAKANAEGDERKAAANQQWLERCRAWATYRGVKEEA